MSGNGRVPRGEVVGVCGDHAVWVEANLVNGMIVTQWTLGRSQTNLGNSARLHIWEFLVVAVRVREFHLGLNC